MSRPTAALLTMTFLLAIPSGCKAEVRKKSDCEYFLERLDTNKHASKISFSLVSDYGVNGENFTKVYDSMPSIHSNCAPGEIAADSPESIKSPWSAPPYVDASAGVTDGTPWVQYVYPRIGDDGIGLASSVVFYNASGHPASTKLASSYLSWENASIIESEMENGVIRYCKRAIEFSEYDENGNIVRPLGVPSISDCERSSDTFP